MCELAEDVNGAAVDLVEQVLEEYGDPAADDPSAEDPGTEADSRGEGQEDTEAVSPADADLESADGGDDDPLSPDQDRSDSESTETTGAGSSALVEREPAADGAAAVAADGESTEVDRREPTDADDRTPSAFERPIEPDSLTETERRTLRAIRDRPDATQQELADSFDVTAATINRRVNNIDGFEWSNREAIVTELFPDDGPVAGTSDDTSQCPPDATTERGPDADAAPRELDDDPVAPEPDVASTNIDSAGVPTEEESADATTTDSDQYATQHHAEADSTRRGTDAPPAASEPDATQSGCGPDDSQLEALTARVESMTDSVEAIEQRLDSSDGGCRSGPEDPELVAKVMHACLQSERIDEAEELRLLESFMTDE